MMPWIKVKKSQRWSNDGISNELLEAGEVYEVSVRCAEVFVREDWAELIPAPEVEEVEDDDDAISGEGDESDDEGDESDFDSDGSQDEEEGSENGGGSDVRSDDNDRSGDEGDSGSGSEDVEEPAATPRAIEVAEELSVDLSTVSGTGTDGVITVEDVRTAASA